MARRRAMIARVAALAMLGLMACAAPAAAASAHLCRAPTDGTLRPIPRALAPAVARAFHARMTPAEIRANGVLRCARGRVLACLRGANLNCGQADTRRTNRGAAAWCRDNPDATFVPLYAAGHTGIYAWACRAGRPVIARQVQQVTPRGFVRGAWRPIPGTAGSW